MFMGNVHRTGLLNSSSCWPQQYACSEGPEEGRQYKFLPVLAVPK